MIDKSYGGQLFVISGPSGVGKGTIVQEILKLRDDVVLSISHSSRKPRNGEIDNQDYHFVSREKFEEMIKQGGFLEYAEVHGNYYGTSLERLDELLRTGKNIIFEVDIQGGISLKKIRPEIISIFILPPNEAELKNRIIHRGSETESSLRQRLETMQKELPLAKDYDYRVVNDRLAEAVQEINNIFNKHIKVKSKLRERV